MADQDETDLPAAVAKRLAQIQRAAEIRQALVQAGAERTAARRRAAELSNEIAALARDAREIGLTKIEIARLAQISRPALDTMLAGDDRP